jgi:xylulokinase
MGLVIGIDLGTSSVKVAALEVGGSVLARATRAYPIRSPQAGLAEQDPEEWWTATCTSIRDVLEQLGARRADVRSVGLAGQMHALVALDERGSPVRPAIIWPDTRSQEEQRELAARVGSRRLHELTGLPSTTGILAVSLLWLRRHEPEAFSRTRTLLLPKDYVRLRLTHRVATDRSDASGTLLFDMRQGDWSSEILDAVELDAGLLPPVLGSDVVAGEVTREASRDCGIPAGTPVVVGAADQMAGALAMGVSAPGVGASVIGSGGQLITTVRAPVVDAQQRVQTFCHALPDAWLLMGAVLAAGLSFDWLASLVGSVTHKQLLAEAAAVPAGADGLLFLPYLNGSRTPVADPAARGAFVGLRTSHSRAHLVRAVLEGVAFAMRDGLEVFDELGVTLPTLICSGGGARDPLWRHIQAAVYGRPLLMIAEADHSAYGAALLGAAGAGLISKAEAGLDVVEEIEPDPATVETYDTLFGVYRSLYPALRPVFGRLG